MAHVYIYKPCEACGQTFTMKGLQTVQRQERARFCSIDCRSAAGRRDVTCEHCGVTVNMKASLARRRRFCSRSCMFAKWGCSLCSKIRPEKRRSSGDPYCSDRCGLTAQLETDADQSSESLAYCGRCKQLSSRQNFTKEVANRNGLSYECRNCSRDYYENNKVGYQRRRYIYQSSPGGIMVSFTEPQLEQRFALWGGRCWMCGVTAATETDHVKPISRGGSHCLANLRPICKRCNARKRNTWPLSTEALRANFTHPSPRQGDARDEVVPRQPRLNWTCPQCEKTELIRAHLARSRVYCSRECAARAKRLPTIDKTCQNSACMKPFVLAGDVGSERRKFCSIECAWVARDRPAHWNRIPDGQLTLF